jgi:uncharacterized protein YceH (UPF0502 family)
MSDFDADLDPAQLPPVRELTKLQRRVLGTMVEKAFTVPESYPLTLKAATSGCNQKSNRSPVTTLTEDAVLQTLDELRAQGLVAVVHTESGRTERYRHYARKRFPFSEPQLAIITELLLRGRQQLGELRSRASRMVPIESLADLRNELEQLLEQGYVQANGDLERRGIEVDHLFYLASENMRMQPFPNESPAGNRPAAAPYESEIPARRATGTSEPSHELEELRQSQQELRIELEQLRGMLEDVKDDLLSLRQSLGA